MSEGWPAPPATSWWDGIWRRFWALPLLMAAASVALGLVVPYVEGSFEESPGWVFQGGVDGARSVLSTIAGAMISVTGLVFSITMVVLQLASSQFSPRILASFLESRVVQLTLGAFTGSFVYALTVLRAVRGGQDERVPELAVTVSYLYVLVAVAAFLAFIHHITTMVQVSQVMVDVRRRSLGAVRALSEVGQESRAVTWSPAAGTPRVELVNDDRSGYVADLDPEALARVAGDLGGVVELHLSPGDFVAPGQPIGRLWGRADAEEKDLAPATRSVRLTSERKVDVDVGFGVRQLLDIAERALSPGVNDPTTALQAVNELHVVLRLMAQLPDPSPYLVKEGAVVAVYRPQHYGRILHGAVTEMVHYGSDSVRMADHLRTMLDDLMLAATPQHRQATVDASALLD